MVYLEAVEIFLLTKFKGPPFTYSEFFLVLLGLLNAFCSYPHQPQMQSFRNCALSNLLLDKHLSLFEPHLCSNPIHVKLCNLILKFGGLSHRWPRHRRVRINHSHKLNKSSKSILIPVGTKTFYIVHDECHNGKFHPFKFIIVNCQPFIIEFLLVSFPWKSTRCLFTVISFL